MREWSRLNKFDAIIMWKFDRLARDHDQVTVIKLLLRKEYGLKLFCVEGHSEDDDNSPYSMLMEQMLAVFSAFYSRNLSTDTKRRKSTRAEQGEFNGSVAPFGYRLVRVPEKKSRTSMAIPQDNTERPGLHIVLRHTALVRRAFRKYATGKFSDAGIADWLNQRPEVQRLRAGQKPFDKETIRHMLQNKIYTGRVCHADTEYNGTLGEHKKSNRHRKTWYEGKHQGIVSDELFETAQQIRKTLASVHKVKGVLHDYPTHDKVWCVRCLLNKPSPNR